MTDSDWELVEVLPCHPKTLNELFDVNANYNIVIVDGFACVIDKPLGVNFQRQGRATRRKGKRTKRGKAAWRRTLTIYACTAMRFTHVRLEQPGWDKRGYTQAIDRTKWSTNVE
jgi:hypothetical protein